MNTSQRFRYSVNFSITAHVSHILDTTAPLTASDVRNIEDFIMDADSFGKIVHEEITEEHRRQIYVKEIEAL